MFSVQFALHASGLVEAEQHVWLIDEQVKVSEKVLAKNPADLGIRHLDPCKIKDGDLDPADLIRADADAIDSGERGRGVRCDRDDADGASEWEPKLFCQRRFDDRNL